MAGGTGGLGQAVSLAFLAEGASVAVSYRDRKGLDALDGAADANGARLEGHRVDVADEAAVGQVVDDIVRRHGRLDVLVNAVGGYAAGAPLWELDGKTLEQMLSLNLRSGFVLARAVLPTMLEKKQGAIVNVASRAAFDHAARSAAYAASKAAAVAMIDSLAADLKGTGVRANSILPSIIDTPANRQSMPKADFAAWPKPDEIASVILFLCSDEARLIHGAAIPV
ncbi:MAG TPA: SDR family oxidoreductase [Beijerinckiaceae bacterium]|nr:SDR family oxidoreductase [Beijerinckiaceae bacterium]